MRRVGTVCGKFSGSTEATRTSGAADSLAEGLGMGEVLILTFHHQLARVRVSGRRRRAAPSLCGQNVLPMLGSRVLRGLQNSDFLIAQHRLLHLSVS